MDMEIAQWAIDNAGLVLCLGYFIYRDIKFNQNLISLTAQQVETNNNVTEQLKITNDILAKVERRNT